MKLLKYFIRIACAINANKNSTNKELTIEFKILMGEDQILIEELLKAPERLLNYYLAEEDLTDSTFQGGYCISIDGKKWNGKEEFNFDIFSYTLNWLSGIEKILLKELTVAEVGFWEESQATATLKGKNKLEIIDTWSSNRIIAESTVVDFEIFCKLLLLESRKYELLASLIKNEIATKKLQPNFDIQKGERIIKEMCGDNFTHYCNSIENLIKKKTVTKLTCP